MLSSPVSLFLQIGLAVLEVVVVVVNVSVLVVFEQPTN